MAQTTEQKIRGGDRFADWVLLVVGYDLGVLADLATSTLSQDALAQQGAQPGAFGGLYTLSFSATAAELA